MIVGRKSFVLHGSRNYNILILPRYIFRNGVKRVEILLNSHTLHNIIIEFPTDNLCVCDSQNVTRITTSSLTKIQFVYQYRL